MPRPNRLVLSLRSHLRAVAASAGVVTLCGLVALSMHHASYAKAADSATLASNVVRSAPDLAWKQNPSSSLSSAGRNSINLDSCPPGVIATEPAYYVYIAGSGNPEAVHVNGGTCKGDGHAGTLEFTTANPHPAGYSVGSASGGIQEASIAARFVASGLKQLPQSGHVIVSPGEYDIYAPIVDPGFESNRRFLPDRSSIVTPPTILAFSSGMRQRRTNSQISPLTGLADDRWWSRARSLLSK